MSIRRSMVAAISASVVLIYTLGSAAALPDGRHYEMVTPSYKGGNGVFLLIAAAAAGEREGEGVVFDSAGVFSGQPEGALTGSYIARRGSASWMTSPLLPPQSVAPSAVLNDISPSLEGLYYGEVGPNQLIAEQEGPREFLFHDLFASDTRAAFCDAFSEPSCGLALQRLDERPYQLVGSAGADLQFCHVMFGQTTSGALLPEARKAAEQLYELVTAAPGCGGTPSLRLVAVDNEAGPSGEPKLIDRTCRPRPGGNRSRLNDVASEGLEMFFTTELAPGCETVSNPGVLFVRLNGERTVEISKPVPTDCESGSPCSTAPRQTAEFIGANEVGTRVFFSTVQPLVTSDSDSSNDIYMARVGCPTAEEGCAPAKREVKSLVRVSRSTSVTESPEVQRVLAMSPDGLRVYFTARGALTGVNNAGAGPRHGADNLYVANIDDGTLDFIAELCSGPNQSGEIPDSECPDTLTNGSGLGHNDTAEDVASQVQTTDNGSFLLFATYARLVPGDDDASVDVYRYDVKTGTLDRVSIGERGYDANGNDSDFNSEIPFRSEFSMLDSHELGDRAITEDGSRVVFETAAPLSPQATNGLVNAYEWHEDQADGSVSVSLVSTGHDEEPVGEFAGRRGEVVITPSGRDLFFVTVQGLSSKDTDGVKDVYDARIGPGFPAEAASLKACEGDGCQGPLMQPMPVAIPGSMVETASHKAAIHKVARKRKRPALRRRQKTGRRHARLHGKRGVRR